MMHFSLEKPQGAQSNKKKRVIKRSMVKITRNNNMAAIFSSKGSFAAFSLVY